jgi:hypothetical protein
MIILFFLFLFFHIILCQSIQPHKLCANVLVPDYIKHVNSQMSKVVTKILSLDHVFKILSSLMKSNHNSFISSKILRQKHEHAFFFFLKKKG